MRVFRARVGIPRIPIFWALTSLGAPTATGKGTSSTRAANRPRKYRASAPEVRPSLRHAREDHLLGLDHRGIPPFAKNAKYGPPGEFLQPVRLCRGGRLRPPPRRRSRAVRHSPGDRLLFFWSHHNGGCPMSGRICQTWEPQVCMPSSSDSKIEARAKVSFEIR